MAKGPSPFWGRTLDPTSASTPSFVFGATGPDSTGAVSDELV
jgi:hypothetical protein